MLQEDREVPFVMEFLRLHPLITQGRDLSHCSAGILEQGFVFVYGKEWIPAIRRGVSLAGIALQVRFLFLGCHAFRVIPDLEIYAVNIKEIADRMVSGKTDIAGVVIVMDAVAGDNPAPFIRRHGNGILIAFQLMAFRYALSSGVNL